MSSDLFAAFEDVTQSQPLSGINNRAFVNTGRRSIHHQTDQDADEEFGDFEDATAIQSIAQEQPSPVKQKKGLPFKPRTELKSSSTTSRAEGSRRDKPAPTSNHAADTRQTQQSEKDSRIGRHPFADQMDVLFAADENDYVAGQDEWHDLSNNPEAAMAYSKRIIQEQIEAQAREAAAAMPDTNRLSSRPEAIIPEVREPEPILKPKNLDVLFDADDLSDAAVEDDDTGDWGDFEGTNVNNKTLPPVVIEPQQNPVGAASHSIIAPKTSDLQSTSATFDLLGLDEPPAQSSLQPSTSSKLTSQPLQPRQPLARSAASFNAIIEKGFTDVAWDDFEDVIPSTAVPVSAEAVRKTSVTQQLSSLPKLPPANVPPPSVILSVFPDLLKQSVSQDTVMDRVAIATVLAHVVAGRKHRWKRSATLAASMRIGPSAPGGKGGMKLTGLDRTESAKEDREVVDVLAAWHSQLGRLRSAYAIYIGSTSSENRLLQAKLPEVNDPAPIKILKPQEGGIIAPHECALCGLKRQERIAHVDDNVEDSFGEFWTEGADMHTSCAKWWVANEVALRSR